MSNKTEFPKATKIEVLTDSESFEVNDKRFCLPGVKVCAVCPTCGVTVTRDYSRDYLDYPTANAPILEYFSHTAEPKDHEFTVSLILRITLEVSK